MKFKFILFTCLLLSFFLDGKAQWSEEQWNLPRYHIPGASNDKYLFLPGGYVTGFPQNNVDILNTETNRWSSLPLNNARAKVGATANENFLFCAGGIEFNNFTNYNDIEIFDLATMSKLKSESLSKARTEISAVIVGTKVLFAGGISPALNSSSSGLARFDPTDIVDIYDLNSEKMEQASLSEARGGMAHAVLNGKAYFAGGVTEFGNVSDVVDIYDSATDSWSTIKLPVAKAFYGGGVAFDGKVYFAGGILSGGNVSNKIDIYDPEIESWSEASLSQPRATIQAAATENTLIFACGASRVSLRDWMFLQASDVVDVYYKDTDTWNRFTSSAPRFNHSTLRSANKVYILGGANGGTLSPRTMDVFTENITTSIESSISTDTGLEAYPNPVRNYLHLSKTMPDIEAIKLMDSQGRIIHDIKLISEMKLDMSQFPSGLYFLIGMSKAGKIITTNKILHQD
ncbi:MAG: T9SS type A sorting domain-containing protein [Bacteroidota bacterium]